MPVFKRFSFIPFALRERAVFGQHIEEYLWNSIFSQVFFRSSSGVNAPRVGKRLPDVLEIKGKCRLVSEQIQLSDRERTYGYHCRILRDLDPMFDQVTSRFRPLVGIELCPLGN